MMGASLCVALYRTGPMAVMAPLAVIAPLAGRLAFASVFVALIVWIILIPAERLGHQGQRIPVWKNTRTWAVLVATVEALVYLLWV